MAHTPHLGDLVQVRPLVQAARDPHGRPLTRERTVPWSSHWQSAYDAGDIEASVGGVLLSADAPPPAAAPAPAAAPPPAAAPRPAAAPAPAGKDGAQ